MVFWSCRNNGLTTKMLLTSKFMTSQAGQQTIAIHILPNISRSKDNQTVNNGQLKEYNDRNTFIRKLCRKLGRKTKSRPLLFFRKAKYAIKTNSLHLVFKIF